MSVVLIGAVAYDPKVVSIWEGFKQWLRGRDVDIDFVLYSNYERQTEDLMADRIDLAWHSPLAWVRTRRLAEASGARVRALFMRDTDRDLRSAVGLGRTAVSPPSPTCADARWGWAPSTPRRRPCCHCP